MSFLVLHTLPGGMPPKVLEESKYLHVFQENSKLVERMAWKNMDVEQCSQLMLPLFKSLAKIAVYVKKSDLRCALKSAKLSLTNSEGELLLEKIKTTFTWVRRRLRDAGSGVYLPAEVKAIARVWGKGKGAKAGKKGSVEEEGQKSEKENASTTSGIDMREVFGLSPKREVESKVVEVNSSDSESSVDVPAAPSSSSTPAIVPGSWA